MIHCLSLHLLLSLWPSRSFLNLFFLFMLWTKPLLVHLDKPQTSIQTVRLISLDSEKLFVLGNKLRNYLNLLNYGLIQKLCFVLLGVLALFILGDQTVEGLVVGFHVSD